MSGRSHFRRRYGTSIAGGKTVTPSGGRAWRKQRGYLRLPTVLPPARNAGVPEQRPVVLIDCHVDPVVRTAMASAWSGEMDLRIGRARRRRHGRRVRASGAAALITRRDAVESLRGRVGVHTVLIGIAASNVDLVVCRGSTIERVSNPTLDQIAALILGSASDS